MDKENIGIKTITLSEPTLDDVFLRETGRSLKGHGSWTGQDGEAK